jgi:hypothetical protein
LSSRVIGTTEICAGTRHFGTLSSGFGAPLGDELADQIAIFRNMAGNDALRLLEPFLSRLAVHDRSQMIWCVGLADADASGSQLTRCSFAGIDAI